MKVLVVGMGPAGIEAALAVRAADPAATITVVSAEASEPLARTAWMYVFAGQMRVRDTTPWSAERLDTAGIVRVHDRAVYLDVAAREVHLVGGRVLDFDALVLAVGSRARSLEESLGRGAPRPPQRPRAPTGSETRSEARTTGLHAFVSLEDLTALDAEAHAGQRALVVGGGLIGVELAEVLAHRGLRVTWLVREPHPLAGMLDAREAAHVAARARAHGVDLVVGTEVVEVLRGDSGHVRGARTGARTDAGATDARMFDADLVVLAIGVVPNTAWLAGALTLDAGGGIVVDAALRAAPGVWAAGDCASVPVTGGPGAARRVETTWASARAQGRIAGRGVVGEPVRYAPVARPDSAKCFELEVVRVGWVPGEALRRGVDPPPPQEAVYSCWYAEDAGPAGDLPSTLRIVVRAPTPVEDAVVIGVQALGRRWDTRAWERWVAEGWTLARARAHLHEARWDAPLDRRFPSAGGR